MTLFPIFPGAAQTYLKKPELRHGISKECRGGMLIRLAAHEFISDAWSKFLAQLIKSTVKHR
jgi:hypothetical protein